MYRRKIQYCLHIVNRIHALSIDNLRAGMSMEDWKDGISKWSSLHHFSTYFFHDVGENICDWFNGVFTLFFVSRGFTSFKEAEILFGLIWF